jgi:hypothetical protein
MGNCVLVLNSHSVVPRVSSDSASISRTNSKELVKEPRTQRLTQNVIKEILDQDIREFYDIDNQPVLGSGISGKVRMCVHKATKLKFALKTLNKVGLPPEKLLRLRNEVGCMAHLDHPNILRVHEVFETNTCIYLVMALCRGGHLMDRLFAQQGRYYREKIACKYIYSILSAVAYCHSHNVVHRDLKLENILFETEGKESELKLIGTRLYTRLPYCFVVLTVVSVRGCCFRFRPQSVQFHQGGDAQVRRDVVLRGARSHRRQLLVPPGSFLTFF